MAKKINANDNLESNKDIIFDILGKFGLESFVVTFDGGGDDGQIEEPCEFKPGGKAIQKKVDALLDETVNGARVSDGIRWSPQGQEQMWKENPTLRELIGSVCYEMLESVQSGWEINEGSHGSFYFDAKKRQVDLDFNERIIESNLTQYKL